MALAAINGGKVKHGNKKTEESVDLMIESAIKNMNEAFNG